MSELEELSKHILEMMGTDVRKVLQLDGTEITIIVSRQTCLCGKEIIHKRVGMCSSCYENKRKLSHEACVLKAKQDPIRNQRIVDRQHLYYQKSKENKPVKMCGCGNPVLKRSKYGLCIQCSVMRSYRKKIRKQIDLKKSDPAIKIRSNLSGRLRQVLNGNKRGCRTIEWLGCSINHLMKYLESKFYDREDGTKMGWDNYGTHGWHIDHIVPLVEGKDNHPYLRELFLYTNLQPLWKEDHIKKTAKENSCV